METSNYVLSSNYIKIPAANYRCQIPFSTISSKLHNVILMPVTNFT